MASRSGLLRLLLLAAAAVALPSRAGGIPGPGEERSYLAPLEVAVGPGFQLIERHGWVTRVAYSFRPNYAWTVSHMLSKPSLYERRLSLTNMRHDLRLGAQASGFVWEDMELLLTAFHRMRLTSLRGPSGFACGGPQRPCPSQGVDVDVLAAEGLHFAARYWLMPRFTVQVQDGMEWNWELGAFEAAPLGLYLGVHF